MSIRISGFYRASYAKSQTGAGAPCRALAHGRLIMKKPNLLFLYTDEQAFNTLAAYGNDLIQMPNLNRLADQSVVFENAYVTQPVCTPSRSSLLTGLYPHSNGCTENNIPLRPETSCLPEMIERGEYVTAHYGKWHLGDELFRQHGFDEWVSIEDHYNLFFTEGRDKGAKSSYHDFLVSNGFAPGDGDRFSREEAARLPEEFGKPAFLGGRASDFIRANKDNPFILYVNFLEPHMPFFGPRDNQYDRKSVPLPPNFENEPSKEQAAKSRLLKERFLRSGFEGKPLKTEDDWRDLIARYWGLCSLVDTHAGKILRTLEECGLWDDTLIVFTSDHGDMMGSHRLLAKCLMFEESVRVPFMMKLPGQRKSGRVAGPVNQIDVVPTLLDLLGERVPGHLQGASLKPLLEAGGGRADRPVVIEWNGGNNGMGDVVSGVNFPEWMTEMFDADTIRAAMADPVRSIVSPDGWKFNCSPRGEHELYNLNEDPLESRNLFACNTGKARELRCGLAEWQASTGDTVVLPEIR